VIVPTNKEPILHQASRASPSRTDSGGNQIHNQILLRLPSKEWEVVQPALEFMRFKPHYVLHEAGETIKSGYFSNTGMFSVLAVMPDGTSVEVGLFGKDGFSGVLLAAGFRTIHTRTVVQSEVTAFRIGSAILRKLLPTCPKLERQLHRVAQMLSLQAEQIAVCSRFHGVAEQLAKWLLMAQDCIGSDNLPLTQEFIAQMLGTRRSSVTIAAGILQKAGLIQLDRGNVTILNRSKLKEATCDCYAMLRQHSNVWQGEDD